MRILSNQIYSICFYRCLEKNPENRPFMGEIIEHPFFCDITADTGSDTHVIIIYFLILFLINAKII